MSILLQDFPHRIDKRSINGNHNLYQVCLLPRWLVLMKKLLIKLLYLKELVFPFLIQKIALAIGNNTFQGIPISSSIEAFNNVFNSS